MSCINKYKYSAYCISFVPLGKGLEGALSGMRLKHVFCFFGTCGFLNTHRAGHVKFHYVVTKICWPITRVFQKSTIAYTKVTAMTEISVVRAFQMYGPMADQGSKCSPYFFIFHVSWPSTAKFNKTSFLSM